MAYKTVLAYIVGSDEDVQILDAAAAVAAPFSAHIDVLHVRPTVEDPAVVLMEAINPGIDTDVEGAARAAAERAHRHFDVWHGTAGISAGKSDPGATWHGVVGVPERVVTRFGRLSDLIVIGGTLARP